MLNNVWTRKTHLVVVRSLRVELILRTSRTLDKPYRWILLCVCDSLELGEARTVTALVLGEYV